MLSISFSLKIYSLVSSNIFLKQKSPLYMVWYQSIILFWYFFFLTEVHILFEHIYKYIVVMNNSNKFRDNIFNIKN
jgi:hypothetical protein